MDNHPLALLFPAGAAAAELAVAGVFLLLARAPGWQPLRWFAVICVTAALYTATNLGYRGLVGDAWLAHLYRLDVLSICLNMAAWIRYSRQVTELGSERVDYAWTGVLLLAAGVSQVPGVVCTDVLVPTQTSLLGLSSRVPETTLTGTIVVGVAVCSLGVAVTRFWRSHRRKNAIARVHLLGFALFVPTVAAETLSVLGISGPPPIVDLGFLGMLAVVTMGLADTFTRSVTRTIQAEAVLGVEVRARDEALEATQRALRKSERLAELGQLAATIGHEINNPITYIQTNLSYVREAIEGDRGEPETLRQALDDASAGAERIGVLVKDLAWFARTSETLEEPLVRVEVGRAINEALRLTGPILRQQAELRTHLDADGAVQAPTTGLVQVMVNLVLSTLALGQARPGLLPLEIRTQTSDGGIVITVTTDETHFDESLALPSASGEWMPHQGMTLGLSVVRRILQRCGGHLHPLEHPPGFRVVLPVVSERNRSPVTPHGETRRLRVLLIDDDRLVLRALTRTLEGHSVRACHSGRDALEALAMESWDVVLCDLMMPEITGQEIYARVAQVDERLAGRFLFLTGGATTESARAFLEEPGRNWLAKPVDPFQLLEALQRHARRR